MFFTKKKKLIEIENKIDSVMERLSISNHMQEDILSFLNRIENRLDSIEQKIDDNHSTLSQSVKETKASIIEEIDILKKFLKSLNDEMGKLSKKNSADSISMTQSIIDKINLIKDEMSKSQKESIVTLGESISHSRELLQQLISDDGTMSRGKMETAAHELDNKFDMIDLSLRLLLLNSVMDQIEE